MHLCPDIITNLFTKSRITKLVRARTLSQCRWWSTDKVANVIFDYVDLNLNVKYTTYDCRLKIVKTNNPITTQSFNLTHLYVL